MGEVFQNPNGGGYQVKTVDEAGKPLSFNIDEKTYQTLVTKGHIKPNGRPSPGPIANTVGLVIPKTLPNLLGDGKLPEDDAETDAEEDSDDWDDHFDEWRDRPRTDAQVISESEQLLKQREAALASGDARLASRTETKLALLNDEISTRGIKAPQGLANKQIGDVLSAMADTFGGMGRMRQLFKRRAPNAPNKPQPQPQAAAGGRRGYVKGPRNPCDHPNDNKKKKKYVVYKADEYDASGKKIGTYVGRTSGAPGESTDKILSRRHSGHHRSIGMPQPLFETDSYAGVRGAEQIYKDKIGTSKQINPVSPKNKRKQDYLDCAGSKGAK